MFINSLIANRCANEGQRELTPTAKLQLTEVQQSRLVIYLRMVAHKRRIYKLVVKYKLYSSSIKQPMCTTGSIDSRLSTMLRDSQMEREEDEEEAKNFSRISKSQPDVSN